MGVIYFERCSYLNEIKPLSFSGDQCPVMLHSHCLLIFKNIIEPVKNHAIIACNVAKHP